MMNLLESIWGRWRLGFVEKGGRLNGSSGFGEGEKLSPSRGALSWGCWAIIDVDMHWATQGHALG